MEYLIKSGAIVALFWLFYIIFLERETFFQANRLFFLSGIIIALLLPLWQIPVYKTALVHTVDEMNTIMTGSQTVKNAWDIQKILTLSYFMGLTIFGLRYLISLGSLLRFIQKSKTKQNGKHRIIYTGKSVLPFSFFKYIILPKHGFTAQEYETVIAHEQIHLQQVHSLDLILVGLLQSLQWFNPFVWLFTNKLRQNLEFIADDLSKNRIVTAKTYQYLLLKTATQKTPFARYTNFYNSFIKKRIIMMQQNQSNRLHKFKYLLILPLLGFFILSFNKKEITRYVVQKSGTTLTKPGANDSNLVVTITKKTTEKELKQYQKDFEKIGIVFQYSDLKRNNKNEITSISLLLEDKNKTQKSATSIAHSTQAINRIIVGYVADKLFITQQHNDSNVLMLKADNNGKLSQSSFTSDTRSADESVKVLLVKNGKVTTLKDISAFNNANIKTIKVYKGKEATKRYGKDGKNGVIEVYTTAQDDTNKTPQENTGYLNYKGKTYFYAIQKGKLYFYNKFGEKIQDKKLIKALKEKL